MFPILCHANNPAMVQVVPTMSDTVIEDVIQNGHGYIPAQNLSATDLADVIVFLHQEYPQ